MEIRVSYQGSDTKRHALRALEGTQSLEGIARATTLVSYYAISGLVRKRYPFDGSPPLYLVATKAGSFDALFQILIEENNPVITTIAGAVAISVAANIITNLMALVFSRAVGRDHDLNDQILRREEERRRGNIEALTEAVEPALKRAHTIINNGAGTINIYNGDTRITNFDSTTKAYLEETISDRILRRKEVSVSMLNVNSRYGRVYDFELGRTVSIRVPKDAMPGTLPALASSLRTFSRRVSSMSNLRGIVIITYTSENSLDGIAKRYIIQSAELPEVER